VLRDSLIGKAKLAVDLLKLEINEPCTKYFAVDTGGQIIVSVVRGTFNALRRKEKETFPTPEKMPSQWAQEMAQAASTAGTVGTGSEVSSSSPVQGDVVTYQGDSWEVQYCNSKGLLDLRRPFDGEKAYGISPDELDVSYNALEAAATGEGGKGVAISLGAL
jgi:hypothetical protein